MLVDLKQPALTINSNRVTSFNLVVLCTIIVPLRVQIPFFRLISPATLQSKQNLTIVPKPIPLTPRLRVKRQYIIVHNP